MRAPAAPVMHLFQSLWPCQLRGVPWMASAPGLAAAVGIRVAALGVAYGWWKTNGFKNAIRFEEGVE